MAASAPARFVAHGLWRVISELQGPMQQHSRITQEQCWNEQGESGQTMGYPGSRSGIVVSHQIVNTGNRSTVHLHCIANTPHGPITQNITMVFTVTNSVTHQATMVGKGSLKFASSSILGETFRQSGHWLSGSCPAVLPPAKTETMQGPDMQALDALQKLARPLTVKAHQDASN